MDKLYDEITEWENVKDLLIEKDLEVIRLKNQLEYAIKRLGEVWKALKLMDKSNKDLITSNLNLIVELDNCEKEFKNSLLDEV